MGSFFGSSSSKAAPPDQSAKLAALEGKADGAEALLGRAGGAEQRNSALEAKVAKLTGDKTLPAPLPEPKAAAAGTGSDAARIAALEKRLAALEANAAKVAALEQRQAILENKVMKLLSLKETSGSI
jgi:cell division protein FtsB